MNRGAFESDVMAVDVDRGAKEGIVLFGQKTGVHVKFDTGFLEGEVRQLQFGRGGCPVLVADAEKAGMGADPSPGRSTSIFNWW